MEERKIRCQGEKNTEYNADGWPKCMGYVDADMRNTNDIFELESCHEIWSIFEDYKKRKDSFMTALYPLKYAEFYFSYQGKAYCIDSSFFDCCDELFSGIARSMIDDLWKVGCYKMIEVSELD